MPDESITRETPGGGAIGQGKGEVWGREHLGHADVWVIIPSFASAPTLEPCLKSVIEQDSGYRYRVLVVHSGEEPVGAGVRERFPMVSFAECRRKQLPGKARNWGLDVTSSPWVLFLDSDCLADPGWIDSMIEAAERLRVDGIGGGVRNQTWWSPVAWMMHLTEFGRHLPGEREELEPYFPSCNALYRRSALVEAGSFPEDLFPAEDWLLNARILEAGGRLAFQGRAAVSHIHQKTFGQVTRYSYRHGVAYRRACAEHRFPGRWLARLPTVIAVPGVALGRLGAIPLRLLSRNPLAALLFCLIAPGAAVALFAWALGFASRTAELPD